MALTKVSGDVLQQPIDVGIITATSGNFSGIVTASSVVASSVNVSSASTIGNTVVGGATTELVVSGNSLVTGISSISDTTQSTTKDIGALVVEGGVGVEKRLNVGGIISSEESAIIMNPNSISRDTTIPSNYNAQTIGPTITVNDGVSVTISSNGEWTIT
jgi:hypothetical protein